MHPDMRTLYALQQVDEAIEQLNHQLQSLDPGYDIAVKIKRMREQLEGIKRSHAELEATAREQELQLRTLDERIRRAEGDLYSGRIRNPRELDALQHEIDGFKRTRDRIEMEILSIWEQLETEADRIAKMEAELNEMEQRYQEHLEKYYQLKAAIENQRNARLAERAELAQRLSPAVLAQYEMMRKRLPPPTVAKVVNGVCDHCHTMLTPYLAKQLRESTELVTCESCGRLLYQEDLA